MEKTKEPSRHFFRILIILFLIYIALYIAMESGYYENKIGERVELTNDRIEQFEKDIKDGKEIDLNDYMIEEDKDYGSKFSKFGVQVSDKTEKFMTKGIQNIFNFIGSLFS